MAKKKIRLYKDARGYYIKTKDQRKVRINPKTKTALSNNELIKFLVKYLVRRRRNKRNAKEKGIKTVDKTDAKAFSDAINAVDTARHQKNKANEQIKDLTEKILL